MHEIQRTRKTGREWAIRSGLLVIILLLGYSILPGNRALPVSATALTPTAAPTYGTARLTNESISKTAPAEAVQEIDLPLSGGEYPGCMDRPEEPILDFNNDNLDLTDIAVITTCGWKPDEIVKVSVMDPRGWFFFTEVKAVPAKHLNDVYEADVFFQPGVDAPQGFYRFTLEGSGTVKVKVTFNQPQTAKLYAVPEDRFKPNFGAEGGQQRLQLLGFLPNEPVRLLAYTYEGTMVKFYGWQDFTADSGGRLIVETDLPEISDETEMNYFAYGLETHFISLERFTREGYSKSRNFDMDLYCPGAQKPLLSGVDSIKAASAGAMLDIHQQPGYGSRIVTQTPGDQPIHVYGYPKCVDHAYWWKVSLKDPVLFGWVSETFLGKYIVEASE